MGISSKQEQEMKVYSLLGFVEYEGSDLVGVFGSLEELQKCLDDRSNRWWYDQMGFVLSELGDKIDVLEQVEYISFLRNGKEVG
jgi:hypothetical protein